MDYPALNCTNLQNLHKDNDNLCTTSILTLKISAPARHTHLIRHSRRPHHFLSSHSSDITPIIPIVPIIPFIPIVPIASTFPIIPISPTSQHSRRSPPSLKSLKSLRSLKSLSAPIVSGRSPDFRFRIRQYKMSPGGIRCRMPPGRLKVAVTYSPTFAVPSA